MTTTHLIVFSVPGLRMSDVEPSTTPTLHRWAKDGLMTEITPTFPCVTSPVQASMLTGAAPGEHGVIANGFYHRDRDEVEFWVAHHDVVVGEPVWDALKRHRPDRTAPTSSSRPPRFTNPTGR
jgi:predicted AlkP superfamily pyrophosphatase or phosphodiesterase